MSHKSCTWLQQDNHVGCSGLIHKLRYSQSIYELTRFKQICGGTQHTSRKEHAPTYFPCLFSCLPKLITLCGSQVGRQYGFNFLADIYIVFWFLSHLEKFTKILNFRNYLQYKFNLKSFYDKYFLRLKGQGKIRT